MQNPHFYHLIKGTLGRIFSVKVLSPINMLCELMKPSESCHCNKDSLQPVECQIIIFGGYRLVQPYYMHIKFQQSCSSQSYLVRHVFHLDLCWINQTRTAGKTGSSDNNWGVVSNPSVPLKVNKA